MNDLCPVLTLPEGVQEAEVRSASRRQQGESGPWGSGWRCKLEESGNGPQFSPCARLVKCLYMNCVSNNHPLLFSGFCHAFLKERVCLWLGFPTEGKPHKLPIFCGFRLGPWEGELGVVQAEGLQVKNSGDPETCRGFSPPPPTRAAPGSLWNPEQVKASPSSPLCSPPHKKLTTPPNHPSPTAPHRPSLTDVG